MLQKMAEKLARDSSFKGTNPQYIEEDLYFKCDYELFFMCQEYDVGVGTSFMGWSTGVF